MTKPQHYRIMKNCRICPGGKPQFDGVFNCHDFDDIIAYGHSMSCRVPLKYFENPSQFVNKGEEEK